MISAQVLKKEGRLVRARELLDRCRDAACADGDAECDDIRAFCGARSAEVGNEIPKVVVIVRDDRGRPIRDAQLTIDGTSALPDRPTAVDPGPRVVRATFAGRTSERSFVAERAQLSSVAVTIDLRELVSHRPMPVLAWVLGATTLAATAVAVGTGVATVTGYAALDDCRPFCDPSSAASLRTTAIVADVGTILAVGGAIATAIAILVRPTVVETRWLGDPGSAR